MDIGCMNTFEIVKKVDFGVYLDGCELGEILLPAREIPKDCRVGHSLEAFLYTDSEDRLIATIRKPLAQKGDLAVLKAVDVNPVGAFLDWGLPKDLLVPKNEQQVPMRKGQAYLVYVALDRKTQRLYASSKLDQFFSSRQIDVQEGDPVDLCISAQTDMAYKAIINKTSWGMLYTSEVYEPLCPGQKVQGYVKALRPDGKIDLSLQKPGYDKVLAAKEVIMRTLKDSGGFLAVTDKSPASEIHDCFQISKKTYKQAVGALYKSGRITLAPNGLTLKRTEDETIQD